MKTDLLKIFVQMKRTAKLVFACT